MYACSGILFSLLFVSKNITLHNFIQTATNMKRLESNYFLAWLKQSSALIHGSVLLYFILWLVQLYMQLRCGSMMVLLNATVNGRFLCWHLASFVWFLTHSLFILAWTSQEKKHLQEIILFWNLSSTSCINILRVSFSEEKTKWESRTRYKKRLGCWYKCWGSNQQWIQWGITESQKRVLNTGKEL